MARANSGDSFERKVLEMDTTIRRRIYVTKDEDDGHTNYTDLNIKEQKKAIVVNDNNNNAYSADLLAKMDEVRQKSSQSTAAAETTTSIRVRTRSNLKSNQNRRRD